MPPEPSRPGAALVLEPLGLEHAGTYLEMVRSSVDALRTWLTRGMTPDTPEAVEAFLRERVRGRSEGREFYFLLRDPQGAAGIGFLNSLHPLHRFCNLGYWVRSDRAGRGYATEATRLLARYGFGTLHLQRIEIVVEPANQASLRVAEKAGAVREGLLRNRLGGERGPRDAVMFSLVPSDLGV